MSLGQNPYLSKAEDIADEVMRKAKPILPTVARICLISTFLDDAIRMILQWGEQREFMEQVWNCGWFIASLFVLINFIGQAVGCVGILCRKYIGVSCGILLFIVVLQTIAYPHTFYDFAFLGRNLAVFGGVLLLFSETYVEDKSQLAGVPRSNDTSKAKTYILLIGRILLILMFISLLRFEMSLLRVIELIVGSILMTLILIGYKTKLSALVFVLWLCGLNLWLNAFWMIPSEEIYRDIVKFDFFQTFSIIGAGILVVVHGPGSLSIDERKKQW